MRRVVVVLILTVLALAGLTGRAEARDATGSISGTVTDARGHGLAGVSLQLHGEPGTATSRADGTFEIDGLYPSGYVEVCGDGAGVAGAPEGFLDGCSGALDVEDGSTTSGVQIVLPDAGGVSGTARDAAGDPLAGVEVRVEGADPVTTAADGSYHVHRLTPGTTTVCFTPTAHVTGGSSVTGYLAVCWHDMPVDDTNCCLYPDPVTVTAGSTTGGIDEALQDAAALTGTVTDPDGNPLAGVGVSVARYGQFEAAHASTGSDGRWGVDGLQPGDYQVCFDAAASGGGASPTGYLDMCAGETAGSDGRLGYTPGRYTAVQGQSLDVSQQLYAAASIAGRVTDDAGNPIANIRVTGSFDGGGATDVTDADGRYVLESDGDGIAGSHARGTRLLPGVAYRLFFSTFDRREFVSEYYRHAYSPSGYGIGTPTEITPAAGARTVVDDQLDTAGSINGTVRDSVGGPVGNVRVDLKYDGYTIESTTSADDGTYTLPGLPAEPYTLCFSTDRATGGHSSAGYLDDCDSAHPRAVTLGYAQNTTGVDEALTSGAGITGTVRDRSGRPVPAVGIVLKDERNNSWLIYSEYGGSAPMGSFAVDRLTPGRYTVCLHPEYYSRPRNLEPQCYDHVAVTGTPTPVTLTAGTETRIDPVLDPKEATRGDFDGNLSTDLAVWRPSTGTWYAQGQATVRYGVKGDVPVAGDFDGDGKVDRAVWRPSTGQWFVQGQATVRYGVKGDVPVVGDFDGDGKVDRAVWRPSTGQWFVQGQATVRYGVKGDVPVVGDFDGDGKVDRAVWRPSTGTFLVQGQDAVQVGHPGDVPVVGDYDGDGRADRAVWRPSTGTWSVEGQDAMQWGRPGDIPVVGDYDGDGKVDLAVWRPSTGTWYVQNRPTVRFGVQGDVPV